MFLCFIFEFISLFRQSKGEKSFKRNIKNFFSKYIQYPSNTFIILILAVIDFTGAFLNTFLSHISSQLLSLTQLSEFLFVITLNYLLFRQSIHKHHFVALCFIISGIVLINIKGLSFDFYIFLSIFCNLLFSILDIIDRWIMEFRFLRI